MNRRRMAMRLALLVAFSGLAPILVVGAIAIEILRRHAEHSSLVGLRAVAEQTAARVGAYVSAQKETLRAVGAAAASSPDGARRLEEVVLEAPALGRVVLVGDDTPRADLPQFLSPESIARARTGQEVSSEIYLARDLTPAIDHCIPAPGPPGHAVCASLDLLELWRFVQRIRVGRSGRALTFDPQGRLLASGVGSLRAAILTGEPVPQSAAAARVAAGSFDVPESYEGAGGEDVLGGWARIPDLGWVVLVEQPAGEALRPARIAQWVLGLFAVFALGLSILLGWRQSLKVLAELEVEERWKTAGRIAAGVTHDLGHRVAILAQTAGLAEAGDPTFLPRIRENLRAEVATLRKFVADFADLSRDVRSIDLLPLDLDAFAESVARSAAPHAERQGVRLVVEGSAGSVWVRADRYLLERAVLNLVSNACEASPRGSEVRIAVLAGGDRAAVEVRDEGAGIEPDRLPRLFDAFVSTKRTGAHVGMGLPNVKRIVDAHGGTVTVASALGAGATFRIELATMAPPGTGTAAAPAASGAA
ncbi:MAG TPA: sensor histidine kinase [Anaeromyxobacteraceae bacterium]|nr:sensor histidine kinase [Anaeromyxobacteraceae bacterium]